MTPEDWIRLESRVSKIESAHSAMDAKQDAMDVKLDRILNLLEVGRLGAVFVKGCIAFAAAMITLWLGYKALK